MKSIVSNYTLVSDIPFVSSNPTPPVGSSAAPKGLIFHILADNSEMVDVLDIGFGVGDLGKMIKSNSETKHWQVDGIDGWEVNCQNQQLFNLNIYRNVWHGLAEDLSRETLSKYKIICLLDVIEHLGLESSKFLIRTLLSNMGVDSFLFVSTPLWFYPQGQIHDGDLEEHLIGIPASSMMALMPTMYAISQPLIGGFVYGKNSLKFADFFQPSTNKNFSYEMGLSIVNALGMNTHPGTFHHVKS